VRNLTDISRGLLPGKQETFAYLVVKVTTSISGELAPAL